MVQFTRASHFGYPIVTHSYVCVCVCFPDTFEQQCPHSSKTILEPNSYLNSRQQPFHSNEPKDVRSSKMEQPKREELQTQDPTTPQPKNAPPNTPAQPISCAGSARTPRPPSPEERPRRPNSSKGMGGWAGLFWVGTLFWGLKGKPQITNHSWSGTPFVSPLWLNMHPEAHSFDSAWEELYSLANLQKQQKEFGPKREKELPPKKNERKEEQVPFPLGVSQQYKIRAPAKQIKTPPAPRGKLTS